VSLDIYVSSPKCPQCGRSDGRENINITCNLGPMWREAGFDDKACDGGRAGDILPNVNAAIAALLADPEGFRALTPDNGWGSYEWLLGALEKLRSACEQWPDGELSTWR
jgi:hypothetical protein